jgi:hypothetical protein
MMSAILLAAGDINLKLGFVFLLVLSGLSAGYAGMRAVRIAHAEKKDRPNHILAILISLALSGFLCRAAWQEYDILTDYQYVSGTLLEREYCGKSPGVLFEYMFQGERFTNCASTQGRQLQIPGGRYWVRVSPKHPEMGRMDLDRPVTEPSGHGP